MSENVVVLAERVVPSEDSGDRCEFVKCEAYARYFRGDLHFCWEHYRLLLFIEKVTE